MPFWSSSEGMYFVEDISWKVPSICTPHFEPWEWMASTSGFQYSTSTSRPMGRKMPEPSADISPASTQIMPTPPLAKFS